MENITKILERNGLLPIDVDMAKPVVDDSPATRRIFTTVARLWDEAKRSRDFAKAESGLSNPDPATIASHLAVAEVREADARAILAEILR